MFNVTIDDWFDDVKTFLSDSAVRQRRVGHCYLLFVLKMFSY